VAAEEPIARAPTIDFFVVADDGPVLASSDDNGVLAWSTPSAG
jgi:hypothetical protein